MQNLVIVESPAKGKTIEKYLGKDYKVLASYGHVRDLIPKTGAVDADADFEMKYELISRNKKHVDAIVKALKSADNLYLATDPDREGEAISWHLLEHLKSKNAIKDKGVFRVVFHEITKTAVNHAISNPSELSGSLIEAQQARRALDYLVGFNLSPLLWKKVKPSTSAGRVQSPALRLIVEREAEIDAFVPQEYWTLFANVSKAEEAFECKLHTYKSKALKQFDINTEALATEAQQTINAEANGKLTVTRVEQKERKRQPNAPFTTSTLQQEAASKLRFTTRRTMSVAQQLYEGMKLGSETVGLITYMRTDSVTLAKEAVFEIRDVIAKEFGSDNVNGSPRMFKAKSKNAQEAHEAIRPTSAMRTPKSVQAYLNDEQFKLYELIWNRTVASQMIHATMDTVSADLSSSDGTFFRATGSSIKHAGFMRLYMPAASSKDKDSKLLPPLKMGDALDLAEVKTNQHFTEPPPRFGEASLVKTLEEYDIGRPSTYASIISTLQTREYVELIDRRFHPTDIGKIIIGFLSNHFTQYVDYDFTAKMENDLDDISLGKQELLPLLRDFWGPFKQLIDEKEESVSREEVMQARQIGDDPKTGKPISVRMGRYGPFVQLGHRDDEEKPKFASLLPGQKMDDVTLDDALELFKLPRDLGETDAGETMSTNFGRFGPYIRYGSKFVSLPEEFTPYTVTPEDAKRLVAEKIQADLDKIIHNWEEEGIQVLKGRWGPYITDGNKNAKIPKDVEPETLTLPICQEMLEKAPEKKGRGKKGAAKKKPAAKKKAPAKKAAAKKTTAKKPATKKTAAKKPAAKKAAVKKPAAKKPAAKKTAAKKPAAKKTTSKKATSKKASE